MNQYLYFLPEVVFLSVSTSSWVKNVCIFAPFTYNNMF